MTSGVRGKPEERIFWKPNKERTLRRQ